MKRLLEKIKLYQIGRIELNENFNKVSESISNLIEQKNRNSLFPVFSSDSKPYTGSKNKYEFNISRKRGLANLNVFSGAIIEGKLQGTENKTNVIYSVYTKNSLLLYSIPFLILIWLLMSTFIFTRGINISSIGVLLFITLVIGIICLVYYIILRNQIKYLKNDFERDIISELIKTGYNTRL
jgi:hypothetical protein